MRDQRMVLLYTYTGSVFAQFACYFGFFFLGGAGHSVCASYSAVVLIAGGTGITYVLSILLDLIKKDSEGVSRVRVIEVIWMVQDPCMYTHFIFHRLLKSYLSNPLAKSSFLLRLLCTYKQHP